MGASPEEVVKEVEETFPEQTQELSPAPAPAPVPVPAPAPVLKAAPKPKPTRVVEPAKTRVFPVVEAKQIRTPRNLPRFSEFKG